MRDTLTDARLVCSPTGDGGGPLRLPPSVCECVAYLRARGWEPVSGSGAASLASCDRRP